MAVGEVRVVGCEGVEGLGGLGYGFNGFRGEGEVAVGNVEDEEGVAMRSDSLEEIDERRGLSERERKEVWRREEEKGMRR